MRFTVAVLLVLGGCLALNASYIGHSSATGHSRKVCGRVKAGQVRCLASVLTDSGGLEPYSVGSPQGYGPADWRATYGGGQSVTKIAIVTAYDDPLLFNDLTTYARTFGLPPPHICTGSVQLSCLKKLNQHGEDTLPPSNSSWSVETSLDTETIYGLCPGCRISIIEASSPSITSLTAAVDAAVATGATVVSNSYGGPEFAAETTMDDHYNKPGITMVVSSGDSGYTTNYPAASAAVLAVGGTSLQLTRGRVAHETAWAGSGSGCGLYEPKPTWQSDNRCSHRAIADIAADADPATGAAIYDSYGREGRGWLTLGGTSLAAPLISGLLANSGRSGNPLARLYQQPSLVRDITEGVNGNCRSYLCHGQPGYDGPTGLGVPRGW